MATRPSLPASSSDFALYQSSSSIASSSHLASTEDFNPLLLRFRRPSLLAPPRTSFFSEGRLSSPLTSSFTIPTARRYTNSTLSGEESESDREKMSTDSPSPSVDSGATTPLTPSLPANSAFHEKDKSTTSIDSDSSMKSMSNEGSEIGANTSLATARPRSPSIPPQPPSTPKDREASQDGPYRRKHQRRLSHSIKMPRIHTLVTESHALENEVKSEAQFQRFIASFSEHPALPRTPRALSDRGRFPEDATFEDPSRDEPDSDDEDEPEDAPPFSYCQPTSEPISIPKSVTPAQSVNGDDMGLSESPGTMAMDVDLPSSASGSPKLTAWRYTPPPTSSSAIRSNKRKFDDRYDPYPTSTKRRAVSPSVSYLRDGHNGYFAPRTPTSSARMQLPHPIAIPVIPSPGASSPIVPSSLGNGSRPVSWGTQGVLSSPTLRAQIGLASPVLRPMMRRRDEGREVDGTGEAVGGLTLEETF